MTKQQLTAAVLAKCHAILSGNKPDFVEGASGKCIDGNIFRVGMIMASG